MTGLAAGYAIGIVGDAVSLFSYPGTSTIYSVFVSRSVCPGIPL